MHKMSPWAQLVVGLTVFTCISIQASAEYKRVCYFTNWSQYRGDWAFYPATIPPHLCTHIFYAFATLTNNAIVNREWKEDVRYQEMVSLKQHNPDLKILVSIGGWISNDEPTRTREFRLMSNSTANRTTFIQNAIHYIRHRNLDGLDIDWEYPRPEDHHLQLMKELREAFEAEGQSTNRPRLLLTAAVWGNAAESANRYRMSQLGAYMDIIGIMSYDYYGSWNNYAKQHSILYPETDDAVNLWLSANFPADKLVIGIAAYGRSFTLADRTQTWPESASLGSGLPGPFLKASGVMTYPEVCNKIQSNGWNYRWDSKHLVPYAFLGDQWVGYDNTRSVEIKRNYMIQKGLGGFMVWTLDFDDFRNECGEGTFPLIRAMAGSSQGCGDNCNPTVQTTASSGTTQDEVDPGNQDEVDPGNQDEGVDCSATPPGVYVLPNLCTHYIHCAHNIRYIMACPAGLLFDALFRYCNWDFLVRATRTDCDGIAT